MADTPNHDVNNSLATCHTPVGNSIQQARQVLYGHTSQYNVPCNTPAVVASNVQQKLSFSDQPSPLDPRQMTNLEAVLNDIYSKLQNIDTLPNLLQSLPSIDARLGGIENRFSRMENEIVQMRNDVNRLENRVKGTECNNSELNERLNYIEMERDHIKQENYDLRERVVEMQARSMRENLLFGGIAEDTCEKEDRDNIQTEKVLQNFIKEKLNIPDNIKFHVVHRLRPRQDGKPRTIVAKFERRKDRDRVLKAARDNLKDTQYSIYEQFPNEIMERRNILWPIFKREQRAGRRVRFKEDKLYVDGRRIFPQDVTNQNNRQNYSAPNKQMDRNDQQDPPFLLKHFGPPTGVNQQPIELIKSYDICVFCESKTDDLDILNVPKGYEYFSKNRKKFDRKSGGIVVVFKNLLKSHLSFLSSDSEYVLWLKFNLRHEPNFLLGCVYIPPENSRYSSVEAFDEVENELIFFQEENIHTILIGDFNARCGTGRDFIFPNDDLAQILNFDGADVIDNYFHSFQKLILCDIPLDRANEDKGRCNTFGSKLLSFCKNNNMFICNGRVGSDKGVGRVTSSQTSLIDYCIVSPDLFPLLSEFEVIDFDPLYSDVHCRLHVIFSTGVTTDLHNNDSTPNTVNIPVRWNNEMKDQFVNMVEDKLSTEDLFNKLVTLNVESDTFQSDIDNFVDFFNSIFIDSAHNCFGDKVVRYNQPNRQNKVFQPWFDKIVIKRDLNFTSQRENIISLKQTNPELI
ncbi:unnamed protein product [Mytilus edulis]|uniref:Endonuclease/exonuclease/phosphatase domain-containing protein n=1 Tax=Mytilus edulis TaxID=6550 RepID=A0A8S3SJR2_MYTED|nr:unnamed protein product [Mytilus edulis]